MTIHSNDTPWQTPCQSVLFYASRLVAAIDELEVAGGLQSLTNKQQDLVLYALHDTARTIKDTLRQQHVEQPR